MFSATLNYLKNLKEMKKINIESLFAVIIGFFFCTGLYAQTVVPPKITNYDFHDQSCIHNISDNGKWAVSVGSGQSDASMYTNARLINLETGEITILGLENDENEPVACSAWDVTDGGMAVGSFKGRPGYYIKGKGWNYLDMPLGWGGGWLESVTPDGKYAVGRAFSADGWDETAVLYDLTTGDILDTPGIPTKGSAGEDFRQVRFTNITGDGRYIEGIGDFSNTWNSLGFIYDRQENKCIRPGYNDDGTPVQKGVYVESGLFSPNGKWYVGTARVQSGEDDTECPFRYNMETKEFTFMSGSAQGYSCVSVDNEGTMYASTPPNTPVRTLYVFVNGFWYPMDDLLRLRYGIDIYGQTGYDNTGTCQGLSGDGKTLASFPDPYRSYVIQMNESFSEAALNVNILKDYTATPADGAAISGLQNVVLRFKYNVKLLKDKTAVHLTDKDGNDYGRLVDIQVLTSGKDVRITYRRTDFAEGETYILTVDEGAIALQADETRTSEKIVLNYIGRAKKPVEVVSVSPENGSALAQLSVSTNPIFLTYDTDIKLKEDATAQLYRDDETEPMATLNLATSVNAAQSKMVMVYPSTTQYLFKGSNYRIVIPVGAVMDSNDQNPTEKDYTITYEGMYERPIISDDENIYSEDFSYGVANMLLRDGDRNTPNEEMQGYDFQTGDAYAWVPVRDDNGSADFSAASTSAYTPAGKSDDWMVTPQIYIPDAKCRLDFDAQGFRKTKSDKLKVIVYADETVHNYLDAELCNKMRTEGKVLMDEVVLPGNSEGDLAGDWTTYSFKLNEYAGKSVYIAFVNENEDQSLVFVDNIKVVRDNGFLIGLSSETTVVAKESTPVAGRIVVTTPSAEINSLNLKLLDADKNVIDEISESGLSLKKDDKYDFSFTKELPLTVGKENNFSIAVQLGQYSDEITYTVKDLAFQPTKRVLIEENTGMGCVFCPQGHVAWEHLSSIYGDKVIMAAYHTYTGDIYESGMTSYVQSFLGLSGAPTAKINRGDVIASPMYREVKEGKYYYGFTSPSGDCWGDIIENEFKSDAAADLNVTASYDSKTNKVSVPFSAKFAMDMEKQNIGLFLIVTENGLQGYQENTFASQDPENYIGIEDWCKGGKYGSSRVFPYTQNYVARAHIGTYYGTTSYIPQTVECNTDYTGTIEFDVPTNVQEIKNCNVICMMIDANTGNVINNVQAKITDSDSNGILGTLTDGNGVEEVARYNAAGQMIHGPQKGVNIIKYSDGTTRKVIVK